MIDSPTSSAGRLALRIDLDRCTGCRSCEVACKQEHRLGPGEFRNRVIWLGDSDQPDQAFLAFACQHCERPACLRSCPVNPKAIEKDPVTGVVRVIEDRCTGCGECVIACPYSAMGFDALGHHSVKCDLCSERRANGQTSACASVCPTQAIKLGPRDKLLVEANGAGRTIIDQDHYLLGPATVYLARLARRVDEPMLAEPPRAGPEDAAPRARFHHADRPQATFSPVQAVNAVQPASRDFPYGEVRADVAPDRVELGGCNICFNSCPIKLHFKGEELVRITGNDNDPVFQGRVCPKSQMTLQMYHSRQRLVHPMRRVGARGEGRFVRISWEQALDEIAQRLLRVKEEFGAEALSIFAGTRTGILDYLGYSRLFAQMFGTPNHEGTEPFCAAAKTAAYELVQGFGGSGAVYSEDDIGSAQLYVYFGDNQAETRPVYFGMVNGWRLAHGARMVVVDPRLSVTASKADQWLGIRPGTDMALGLALSQHILSAGLHDARFCTDWIEGFERWRDFIFERGYTPEWAEPVTGIPASTIRALAEDIARADGCVIFAARGMNQHTNGTQTNRVLMFLAAITGNWGRKGGTFFNMTADPPMLGNAPLQRRTKPAQPRVRRSPTGWVEAMAKGKPYPIRALIASSNPMAHWPGQAAAREALASLDLMVHIELFENKASAYADYVLPAASGIEKGEVNRANDERRIVWIDKMIEPPGEARADGWFWIELGKRLGYGDVLKEEYKDSGRFWNEVMIADPALQSMTRERLLAAPNRWLRWPLPAEEAGAERDATLFLEGSTALGEPAGKRFPTPSGKLEFWTETQAQMFATIGLTPLPEFYSEREQLIDLPFVQNVDTDADRGVLSPFTRGATLTRRAKVVEGGPGGPGAALRARGFDTELVSGRAAASHFHSWTHYFWQAQEMMPDLYCQMHAKKAVELGIADGDRVRVETTHGEIEAIAWVTQGIRESAVFIPIGWDERQPFHAWKPVNFLTDKDQRDPLSEQTNTKALLCRISLVAKSAAVR